jgi:glycosyltransferase involved in cell wall biosynthesis
LPEARLRLLLVTDEMEVGGTQRQIVRLARHLIGLGVEVELVYFRQESYLLDEARSAGVVVHQIPKRSAVDPRFFLGLRKLLRHGRYDVIHAFAFSAELWTALAVRTIMQSRPALITSIRGTYEWYSHRHWQLKRWISRQSFRVVANSSSGAIYAAEKMGEPSARIDVVYNGVDLAAADDAARISRSAAALGLSGATGAFRLLFVGRLVDHKNVANLLQAMRLVDDQRIELFIAGDGPLQQELQTLHQSMNLGAQVSWLGERNDVAELMHAVDAVVLPSWREGMSNVLLEAMSAEKPVLASRAGGNPEVVEAPETGLMFDPASPEQIAGCISELAQSPERTRAMGRAGRLRVERVFSTDVMARAMHAIYFDAAGFALSDEPVSEPV